MKRAVITGLGIVSSIGNNQSDVLKNLMSGISGIKFSEVFHNIGMRSQIAGLIDLDIPSLIDRKILRFMGDASAYNYVAMKDAIEDSKLSSSMVSNDRTGIVMGTGGASPFWQRRITDLMQTDRGSKAIGPYGVTKTMTSTNSACLSPAFKIRGVNYSLNSACATSAHCIGHAWELIQLNKQDIVFAGGAEEISWELACSFDAMGALSFNYNDTPSEASRPFDINRDGFVISGGAGVVVVEELEHAKKRGAKIYAEIIGYGANSDGNSMVEPSGEGSIRCMKMALSNVADKVDYINAHGTSTKIGDIKELQSIKKVFSNFDKIPFISSTKSITGHALGAAGVNEAIYSLLMLDNNFIAPNVNLVELYEDIKDIPVISTTKKINLNTVMSNSFGFGGTNACLVFKKI